MQWCTLSRDLYHRSHEMSHQTRCPMRSNRISYVPITPWDIPWTLFRHMSWPTPWYPTAYRMGDAVGHSSHGINSRDPVHGLIHVGYPMGYPMDNAMGHPSISHGVPHGAVHGLSHGHPIYGNYAIGFPMGCSMVFPGGIVHGVTHGLHRCTRPWAIPWATVLRKHVLLTRTLLLQ